MYSNSKEKDGKDKVNHLHAKKKALVLFKQ